MKTPARAGGRDTGAVIRLGGPNTSPHSAPAPALPPASVQLQRGAEHLHACGPRAVAEFLAEMAAAHAIGPAMLARLDGWRELAPATLAAVTRHFTGGRDFPPLALRVPT